MDRVVVCFHLSIFEPLETVDSILVTGIQYIISSFRITKTKLFSIKNPAFKRDFLFLKKF